MSNALSVYFKHTSRAYDILVNLNCLWHIRVFPCEFASLFVEIPPCCLSVMVLSRKSWAVCIHPWYNLWRFIVKGEINLNSVKYCTVKFLPTDNTVSYKQLLGVVSWSAAGWITVPAPRVSSYHDRLAHFVCRPQPVVKFSDSSCYLVHGTPHRHYRANRLSSHQENYFRI